MQKLRVYYEEKGKDEGIISEVNFCPYDVNMETASVV
jgi:hypothetical protein